MSESDPHCNCYENVFGSPLCKNCQSDLAKTLFPRSVVFRLANTPLFAASHYQGPMKNFVYQIKSSAFNGFHSAHKNWVRQVLEFWLPELTRIRCDGIVVVPGHPIRSRLQSDFAWLLGNELSRLLGVGPPLNLLKRRMFIQGRFAGAQKIASKRTREVQAAEQFWVCSPEIAKVKKVLLVDDVSTSGASLKVCMHQLENHGFSVGGAFVFSKVD